MSQVFSLYLYRSAIVRYKTDVGAYRLDGLSVAEQTLSAVERNVRSLQLIWRLCNVKCLLITYPSI